jgi:hypothetical protein
MSRTTPDPIPVKPGIDVYTGLAAAAFVVLLVGLVIVYLKAAEMFPDQPLWG